MLAYSRQSIDDDDIKAVVQALKSDFLTCGKKVEEFEENLCKYLNVKYAVVMNSATSALEASYKALDLKEDDEIITTPITFVATSNAALFFNANIKFCDVKSNGNIDENKIEKLITPKTKAITAVDFAGNPVNIQKIQEICEKYQISFIQDSSHALGSSWKGKKIGGFAHQSIFSFHAIKPITTCEGGALITNNENFAKEARLFRSHGMVKNKLWDSNMQSLGHNFRLSEIACALGISQLKKLDIFINKREKIAQFYDEYFSNNPFFSTIKLEKDIVSSRHLYPILLFQDFWDLKEKLFIKLHEKGIGVQVHYKPVYQNSYYVKKFGEIYLKGAEEFYKSELSIPCHQGMSLDDAKYVATTLLEILSSLKKDK